MGDAAEKLAAYRAESRGTLAEDLAAAREGRLWTVDTGGRGADCLMAAADAGEAAFEVAAHVDDTRASELADTFTAEQVVIVSTALEAAQMLEHAINLGDSPVLSEPEIAAWASSLPLAPAERESARSFAIRNLEERRWRNAGGGNY